jgi:aminoglycoside phosphotransferase (APT) family kinase protein
MPAPQGRDLDATREGLERWFGRKLPDAREIRASGLAGPGTTGFSNDTLMFDLEWRQGGKACREPLVVRIEPTGPRVFPEYDLARQFRIQSLLGETDVPVARMFWEEADASLLGAPFYVMERVEGRIPTDSPPYHVGGWVGEIRPQERASLWWSGLEVLSSIHRLDWKGIGLAFLERPEPGATPVDRELVYYAKYLDWAWTKHTRPHPICAPALDWLWRNRPGDDEPAVLCWGDARIGNMVFRDFRCVAVLDWEMATLGSPELDLAWWLFLDRHHSAGCGVPRLPGFPSRERTVVRYEQLTGRRIRHLDYYEIFAAFRFSVIMIRLAQKMIEYGALPPDSALEIDNIPSRLLAGLLGLPPPEN